MRQALLQTLLPDWTLRIEAQTGSTNDDAKAWLREGAAPWSAVFADRQTAGKGRMGRRFESEAGGLYFSLVLPHAPSGQTTTLCAVAVVSALETVCGIPARIKWVNDVLVQDKKVCGILCEGLWQGDRAVGTVAGIGINVAQPLPQSLQPIAASLYQPGQAHPQEELIAAAVCRLIRAEWSRMPAHMDRYRQWCVTPGKQIAWQSSRGGGEGTALDVEDDGALLVRLPDGQVMRLFSGEVTLHR